MFRKENSRQNDYNVILDTENVRLSIKESGTAFSNKYPCVKAEYFFPSDFKLNDIVQAVQCDSERALWDLQIKTSKVLYTSDSQRL